MGPKQESGQRLWATWHKEMIPEARLNRAACKIPAIRVQISKFPPETPGPAASVLSAEWLQLKTLQKHSGDHSVARLAAYGMLHDTLTLYTKDCAAARPGTCECCGDRGPLLLA